MTAAQWADLVTRLATAAGAITAAWHAWRVNRRAVREARSKVIKQPGRPF